MTPAAALLAAVIAMHAPGDTINFATDTKSYPDKVLLALWLPAGACVITIDAAEYGDGTRLGAVLGFTFQLPTEADHAKAARNV